MKEIILQWSFFTLILAVYVFGFTALLFKIGDWIDRKRAEKRRKKDGK